MKPARMDRLDLISAVVLILFAGGALFESLRMDRLEELNVDPYTAPGLVPGLVSCLLLLCGIVLLVRSLRRTGWRLGLSGAAVARFVRYPEVRRVALTLLLTFVFALGLFGRLAFPYAASIFVFAFIVLMSPAGSTELSLSLLARVKTCAIALGIALVAGFSIDFIFTQVFIVKLP